jgi:hypothetical protein
LLVGVFKGINDHIIDVSIIIIHQTEIFLACAFRPRRLSSNPIRLQIGQREPTLARNDPSGLLFNFQAEHLEGQPMQQPAPTTGIATRWRIGNTATR